MKWLRYLQIFFHCIALVLLPLYLSTNDRLIGLSGLISLGIGSVILLFLAVSKRK